MRIYDGDFTVGRILEDCSKSRRQSQLPIDSDRTRPDVDLRKLNARLNELPIQDIQARRQRMNIFYEEVLVSSDPDRGINFTTLLMILAHYKVINESKSLRFVVILGIMLQSLTNG
jgi:voltage-dependent calcium channel